MSDGPTACLHGAPPGLCAFVGCPHFAPDGPRDERWAFRPGTTEADVAAALAENERADVRTPGSASPIHLVVERKRRDRVEGLTCPTCAGTGRVPRTP
jgi:hypothetical protein